MTAPAAVYLVGAGPGDPELLTRRAARLIEEASCILHDDLVPDAILALARPVALLRNVGKRCGKKYFEQAEIHRLMVEHARAGHTVVRLKAGDSMLYGRAAEEIEALRQAGIPFEIIPGITAAFAAAAAAAVPLTDRRGASRVLFTTGHHARDREIACTFSPDTTVVRYMPGRDYGCITAALLDQEWPADTPCLLVSSAGRPEQQILRTTIAALTATEPLPSPAILLLLPGAGVFVDTISAECCLHAVSL